MISLSSAVSSGLTWSKIPRGKGYELKLNDAVVGSLRRASFWSSIYLAESGNERWTFRRSGFFRSGAEILNSASQRQLASFKSDWKGGGTLALDGQTFAVRCKGFWRPMWSVIAADGQPVLHLHTREKRVAVPTENSVPENRLAMLILFGWYRVLQAEEDAASAATVAVITAT
jgi:hypothetical protein